MDVVNTGDLAGLLALYDDSAVLIPTFSNRLPSEPVKIEDYFVRLCGREELSIALHEKTLDMQHLAGTHPRHDRYLLLAFRGRWRTFELRGTL